MAIIVCKNCGKNVSDTVGVCIHCGKDPKEEKSTEMVESSIIEQINEKKDEEIAVNFSDLGEMERAKLHAEFFNQDEFSKKYMRSRLELKFFLTAIFLYPSVTYVLLRIVWHTCTDFLINLEIMNEEFTIVTAVSGIALVVLCVGMFIYAVARGINNLITRSKYVYYKRFQKWLDEEKNIFFYPELTTLRQKAMFESIMIN